MHQNDLRQQENAARSKTAYISYLNVISTIAVVLLHTNDAMYFFRADTSWLKNLIIETVFYFAVPVFFMLSGATLIDYPDRYDTKTFFKKRFMKTVLPFLFWIIMPFVLSFLLPNFFRVDTSFTINNLFNGIFNHSWFYYYWFFIPLFCAYLCMPLFAFIDKKKKLRVLSFILAIGFAVNVFIPFLLKCINQFAHLQLNWLYSIPVVTGYLLFVIAGYVFSKIEIPPIWRIVIYLIALTALLANIIGTYRLSLEDGKINDFFRGYESLPCVLYALGIFVLVKYGARRIKSEKFNRFIFAFQRYTLEIYLLHRLLLPLIEPLMKSWLPFVERTSALYAIIMAVILIPLCVLITFLLRKIPIVRCIVP